MDTHGSAIIDPVWRLLGSAYSPHSVFPTLLEREFNIPGLADLVLEMQQIVQIQELALCDQATQTAAGTTC